LLPSPVTSFIGRSQEVEAVTRLLTRESPACRLLTLTGPGGVGKTRLALQVGGELAEAFDDGVRFVALADLDDPALVPGAVVDALDVPEVASQTPLESLQVALRDRELLLILDNFEQVIAAAAVVGKLLLSCPRLKLLVTSRAVLRLSGEHAYPVPPLSIPAGPGQSAEELTEAGEAAQLFVERAHAARSDFSLNDTTAGAVAALCRRLDGLPLAIELAAAQVRLLPPHVLLARLDARLAVPQVGSRDAPPRQRTMQATIAWSYELLDAGEQRLFRDLSVFVGSSTLDAVESVCARGDNSGLMDNLASLVDQSILLRDDAGDDARFRLLTTIRDFGWERLTEHGELTLLRSRHAAYFLRLAQSAATEIAGPRQGGWLDRLERDHGNLRAALSFYQASDPPAGLTLATSLQGFWWPRGHLHEGRQWLETLLAATEADQATNERVAARNTRAQALLAAGRLAWAQGDYTAARELCVSSLTMWQAAGDDVGRSNATHMLGTLANWQAEFSTARPLLEESLALRRAAGDARGVAESLFELGLLHTFEGDYDLAGPLFEESLALRQATGGGVEITYALGLQGWTSIARGDFGDARRRLRETLPQLMSLRDRWGLPFWLNCAANLAAAEGRPEHAIRLAGAAAALRETIGAPLPPTFRRLFDGALAPAQRSLGEAAGELWNAGKRMSLEEATTYALYEEPAPAPGRVTSEELEGPDQPPAPLTAREWEVALLVARGLTNRQIANALVVSHRTASTHVSNILGKLDLVARAQLATWVTSSQYHVTPAARRR